MFRISFEPPQHGWMPVTVEADGQEYRDEVSDVPLDSLLHFSWCLIRLQSGQEQTRCEWSLEPAYSVWSFHQQDGQVKFQISVESTERFSTSVPLDSFLKKATNALTKLHRSWPEDPTGWSYPFPIAELEKLRRGLR